MEFLVFGEDYGGLPSSTQHLFNEIKNEYEVIWINSIGLRNPSINKKDIKRVMKKLKMLMKKNKKEYYNLKTINPLVLPVTEHKLIQELNQILLKQKIPRKETYRVLWASLPTAVDYLNITEHDLLVYYCCDDFNSLYGVDHKNIVKKEMELIEKADIIFYSNHLLKEKFKDKKAIYLEHGVHDFFYDIKYKEKQDNMFKIGFYGSISNWLDINILNNLTLFFDNIEIHLLGKIDDNFPIEKVLNKKIIFHKPVKHNKLNEFIDAMDILILPFINNEQIKHCNPIKLKEYILSGKPVVSSNFLTASEYEDYIFIADDIHSFIEKIKFIMSFDKINYQSLSRKNKKFMKEKTWHKQANIILETINKNK